MSSQLDSRQQEVLSMQKKLTTVQQEKDTLQQEFECLVRLRSRFWMFFCFCFHVHCLLMYRLCNCFTDSKLPKRNTYKCVFPHRNKSWLKAQKSKQNQRKLCKVVYIYFFAIIIPNYIFFSHFNKHRGSKL